MENGPKDPTSVNGFKIHLDIEMPSAPNHACDECGEAHPSDEQCPETTLRPHNSEVLPKLAKMVADSAKKVEK